MATKSGKQKSSTTGAKRKSAKVEKAPSKKPLIIALCVAVVVALFAWVFLVTSSPTGLNIDKRVKLDIANGEGAAIAGLRLAAVTSGGWGKTDCKALGKLAKRYTSATDWFECEYSLYAGIADLSGKKVTLLSNGYYCAKFVTDEDLDYLLEYTFEEGSCAGKTYRIYLD